MQQEIEVKFLNVNHDEIREGLKKAGAKLEVPMRLMRRKMFDYPDKRFQINDHSRRLRIRDEGEGKAMINYKAKSNTDYVDEIETLVGSFDDACNLLEAIGLVGFSLQESRRETWRYKNVEVVLDEWPWADTYIEIEGPTEAEIKEAAGDLGFDWADAKLGSVDTAYRAQYPKMAESDSIGDIPEVRFDMDVPQYLSERL